MRSLIQFCLVFLLLCTANTALALERITHFDSNITVNPDASLTIEETIKVIAEGNQIKHGIFRDFPTRYQDKTGKFKYVGFKILSVSVDNVQADYKIEHNKNGQRIYIGSPDELVSLGPHQYKIKYETNNQILYLKDYDELYWNVTGNFWVFPIEKASATVHLPSNSNILQYKAYTGLMGETKQDYTAKELSPNTIKFETTQALPATAGLTIAVGFPKNVVAGPPLLSITDIANATLYGGSFLLLVYYFIAWLKVGRDPKLTVFPQFYPPKDLPPAVISYIYYMGLKKQSNLPSAFTAMLVQMAVKGLLTFKRDKSFFSDTFTIEKNAAISTEDPLEKTILDTLWDNESKNNFPIIIGKSYNPLVEKTLKNLKTLIDEKYKRVYFFENRLYSVIGFFMTGVIIISMIFFFQTQMLEATLLQILTLIFLPIISIIFVYLLKAPTPKGVKTLEHIKGFLMYLTTAEEIRLKNLTPPEMTPQIFERYLPYAIVLHVEQKWGDAFVKSVSQSVLDNYHPAWYIGPGSSPHDFSKSGGFISGMTAMTGALAATATSPSSRGGSGGGGSSGGGGGGGGGGGW